MINGVPFVPSKIVPITTDMHEHYIPKEKKEWCSPEDKTSELKDAKVRNLLDIILDNVISNRVTRCKAVN